MNCTIPYGLGRVLAAVASEGAHRSLPRKLSGPEWASAGQDSATRNTTIASNTRTTTPAAPSIARRKVRSPYLRLVCRDRTGTGDVDVVAGTVMVVLRGLPAVAGRAQTRPARHQVACCQATGLPLTVIFFNCA